MTNQTQNVVAALQQCAVSPSTLTSIVEQVNSSHRESLLSVSNTLMELSTTSQHSASQSEHRFMAILDSVMSQTNAIAERNAQLQQSMTLALRDVAHAVSTTAAAHSSSTTQLIEFANGVSNRWSTLAIETRDMVANATAPVIHGTRALLHSAAHVVNSASTAIPRIGDAIPRIADTGSHVVEFLSRASSLAPPSGPEPDPSASQPRISSTAASPAPVIQLGPPPPTVEAAPAGQPAVDTQQVTAERTASTSRPTRSAPARSPSPEPRNPAAASRRTKSSRATPDTSLRHPSRSRPEQNVEKQVNTAHDCSSVAQNTDNNTNISDTETSPTNTKKNVLDLL